MKAPYTQHAIFALLFVFAFPFILQFLLVSIPNDAQAIGSPRFGGMVTSKINCNCSTGHVIIVGPPEPADVYVGPGSSVFLNFSDNPGHWVLGIRGAPGVCLIHTGKWCSTVPNDGQAILMGTS